MMLEVERVVDVDRRFAQPAEGARDAVPLVVVDLPQAQPVGIDPGLHGEDALHELLGRHLQAEDADRLAVGDRGAVGHAERKAGLAHRRPSGDDDQVRALQPAGELVEIGEAGSDADDFAAVLLQVVDLVEEAVEHVAHGDEVFGLPPLRDGEDRALGGIERVLGVDPLAEADVDDLGAGVDETAQRRGALDDARVVLDVDRGGNGIEQAGEIGEPARLVD